VFESFKVVFKVLVLSLLLAFRVLTRNILFLKFVIVVNPLQLLSEHFRPHYLEWNFVYS